MRDARLLPSPSNAGFGSGWCAPVMSPPSVPGDNSVNVWSLHAESLLDTNGPPALPLGTTMRKVDPVAVAPSHAPAVIRNVPTSAWPPFSAAPPSEGTMTVAAARTAIAVARIPDRIYQLSSPLRRSCAIGHMATGAMPGGRRD